MNYKTTAILAALAIIIAFVLFLFPAKTGIDAKPDEKAAKASKTESVFDMPLETGKVTRVVVDRPGKPRIVMERSSEAGIDGLMTPWKLVEPYAADADDGRINTFVSTIANMQSTSRIEPKPGVTPTVADAGLDAPIAVVTLNAAQREHKIEIGRPVPMSRETYVRVAGKLAIHSANRELASEVSKDASSFLSHKLANFQVGEAVALRIEHEGKKYEMSKGTDGEWGMVQPVQAFADGENVKRLLTELSRLQVETFLDEKAAASGSDAAFINVEVVAEKKKPVATSQPAGSTQPATPQWETVKTTYQFVVGAFSDLKSEKRFVKRAGQPWVATIRQADVDRIVPDVTKLRDSRVTRVKAADATKLVIKCDGQTAVLSKLDGAWHGDADLSALEIPAVQDLLNAFEEIRAIGFETISDSPSKYGLDQPRAEIEITATGQLAPVKLLIGKDTSEVARNTYVQRVGDSTVFVVSAEQAKRLAVAPLSLRSRSIFNIGMDQLRQIVVQRGTQRYVLDRGPASGWRLSEPAETPIDGTAALNLGRDLARLTAKRVVGKSDGGDFGFDQPAMELEFTAEVPLVSVGPAAESQPEKPQTQKLTQRVRIARKNNSTYALRDGDTFVCELDESVFRTLSAELINSQLFSFRPDDVVGVLVQATGGTLELVKEKEKWVYKPDPYLTVLPNKMKTFLEELSKVRVEMWYAYRGADFDALALGENALARTVITLRDGKVITLRMNQEQSGQLPLRVGWLEEGRAFRMKKEDVEKLLRGIEYYTKADVPKPKGQTPEPAPGDDAVEFPPDDEN